MKQNIKSRWIKWSEALNIFCNKRISISLKYTFYKTIARHETMYGLECWILDRKIY